MRASGNSESESARSPGSAASSRSAGRFRPRGSSTLSIGSSSRTIHVPGRSSSSSSPGVRARGRWRRVALRGLMGDGVPSPSFATFISGSAPAGPCATSPQSATAASPRYRPPACRTRNAVALAQVRDSAGDAGTGRPGGGVAGSAPRMPLAISSTARSTGARYSSSGRAARLPSSPRGDQARGPEALGDGPVHGNGLGQQIEIALHAAASLGRNATRSAAGGPRRLLHRQESVGGHGACLALASSQRSREPDPRSVGRGHRHPPSEMARSLAQEPREPDRRRRWNPTGGWAAPRGRVRSGTARVAAGRGPAPPAPVRRAARRAARGRGRRLSQAALPRSEGPRDRPWSEGYSTAAITS